MSTSTQQDPARPRFAREDMIHKGFTLPGHLTRTLTVALAVFALGAWLAHEEPWTTWLTIPVFWLVANVFEWFTHRFPMHRPLVPRMMYRNHALVHHRAFADADAQEIQDVRELSIVMMPWFTILIVFAMASPVAFVAALIGGPGLAGVFLIAAISYFLLYETIHTLHHLPRTRLHAWGLDRWRWLALLREHHHHHHRLDRMAHVNFNVTAPLADWAFGTYEREP